MNDTTTARELKTADIARIMKLLPHRYPILLVDRVLELEPGGPASFDGTVGPIEEEIAQATATVTISAADPMIALDPGRQPR